MHLHPHPPLVGSRCFRRRLQPRTAKWMNSTRNFATTTTSKMSTAATNSSAVGCVALASVRLWERVWDTLRHGEMLATLGNETLGRLMAMVGQEERTDDRY